MKAVPATNHRARLGILGALTAALAMTLPAGAMADERASLPAPFTGPATTLPTSCDYKAGECDFVVDPASDVCFVPGGDPNQPRATFLVRGNQVLAFDWPWGDNPSADHAIFYRFRDMHFNAVSGQWQKIYDNCDRELVNSTGRALGVYAWLTRDELDSLAAQGLNLGYAGLGVDIPETPQDEPRQEEAPTGDQSPEPQQGPFFGGPGSGDEPRPEEAPAGDRSADGAEVDTAAALRAARKSRAVPTAPARKSKASVKTRSATRKKAAAKKKAAANSKRPAAKKRGR